MNPLVPWQNFYVIIGSAAGALIGIQFVVIALIASRRERVDMGAISAFGTPTVFHFGSSLAVAAIMAAPWPSVLGASILLCLCGAGGLVYVAIVFLRARRQTDYKPIGEDWVWYMIFPSLLYVIIAVAASLVRVGTQISLFVIAAATLCMLVLAVHNAWDTVTHIVSSHPQPSHKESEGSGLA